MERFRRRRSGKRSDVRAPAPAAGHIPELMTLRTLGDLRKLLGHLPPAHRAKPNWRYVADRIGDAARGADVIAISSYRCAWCYRWKASRAGRNSRLSLTEFVSRSMKSKSAVRMKRMARRLKPKVGASSPLGSPIFPNAAKLYATAPTHLGPSCSEICRPRYL